MPASEAELAQSSRDAPVGTTLRCVGAGQVLARTRSDGVTLNDTLLHVAQDDLPFGGVGASGMGAYHGEDGFRSFSHYRPVFAQSRLAGIGLMKPPYGAAFDRLMRWMVR